MASYINTGAYVNGIRPKSKKALREAMAADPSTVSFDRTAIGFDGSGYQAPAEGISIQVTGPDPYNDRRWYATVTVKNGVIKVS